MMTYECSTTTWGKKSNGLFIILIEEFTVEKNILIVN